MLTTEILSANDCTPAAVALLREGQIVALPAETVYGLAGDALNPTALARIFEAKERPYFDPLILHLPDMDWLEKVVRIPRDQREMVCRLAAAFWPGPLTIVLPRRGCVPDLACSGLPSVAVRIPSHPVFQAVLRAFGAPLAAPSANRFGRISPTSADHVRSELEGRIPLIVDGGDTPHGLESTIIAVQGPDIVILRPGPVSAEELAGFAAVRTAGLDSPTAPGSLPSHYAPCTPMKLYNYGERLSSMPGQRCGLLTSRFADLPADFAQVEKLGSDPVHAAAHLFAAMRRLDAAGLDLIVAELVADTGIGRAINDRLRRAAHRP